MRSIAGPDNTGCVQHAYTAFAPLSISASAATVIVPAVSIISSIRIAVFPVNLANNTHNFRNIWTRTTFVDNRNRRFHTIRHFSRTCHASVIWRHNNKFIFVKAFLLRSIPSRSVLQLNDQSEYRRTLEFEGRVRSIAITRCAPAVSSKFATNFAVIGSRGRAFRS